MTELYVIRQSQTTDATLGDFYWEDQRLYYTCEPLQRDVKIMGSTAIPLGRYPVVMSFSPHFGKDMPHINNIPNFSDVMIHNGNAPKDTEGCILIGLTRMADGVGNSVAALNDFIPRLNGALLNGLVWVTVSNNIT